MVAGDDRARRRGDQELQVEVQVVAERVAVVGGQVTAGPAPDGGFVVTARLPYSLDGDLVVPPVTAAPAPQATAPTATPEVTA